MPKPAEYISLARARAKRALLNMSRKRMRCFLEPAARRGSVRGLYKDLRWMYRAKPSSFEQADIAFIQKDHYSEWQERRKTSHLGVALSQLPHVTQHLVAKAPLAELMHGRPYAPDTFIDTCEGFQKGIWVQKPSIGGRGRDITFLRDPENWQKSGFVLQRYLNNPYLIEGCKFDVRVLAKIDDKGRLQFHPEGLIRCANQTFDPTSLDPQIHNSNIIYQKRAKMSRGTQQFLSQSPFAATAIEQIGAILEDIQHLLHKQGHFRSSDDFEILGIDFLVDHEEKFWVLEINQHPGWYSSYANIGHFYLDALDSLFV